MTTKREDEMGKTLDDRVAKLEGQVAELLTYLQTDTKDMKKLKKELRSLKDEHEKLEHEVRLLRREV